MTKQGVQDQDSHQQASRQSEKMLEQLDTVEWSKLIHAYGTAEDVPGLIRSLASTDAKLRENVMWQLYGNIFHQGTRYQATPFAIPFLYELIANPEVPEREQIIYLLVNLALGYEEEYLPDGLNSVEFRRVRKEELEGMPVDVREECEEYGFGPQVELDCYDAVQQGLPLLQELTRNSHPMIALAAVYVLAWFPERATESIPCLERYLAGAREEIEIANAVLALGLLARSSGVAIDEQPLRKLLSHSEPIVRVATAIALVREPLEEELLGVLIEALKNSKQLEESGKAIRFNEGNLRGYVSLVLAGSGTANRNRIVPALCETLKTVNPYQSLDVTNALLHLIAESVEGNFEKVPANDLDPLQFLALQSIAEHGGWIFNDEFGGTFSNYTSLVRSYGLPDSQKKLRKYLSQRTI